MKQVSTREFQLHMAQWLKQLPIVLTQYKKPIAIVNTFSELEEKSVNTNPIKDNLSTKSVNTSKEEKLKVLTETIKSVDTSINEGIHKCEFPRAFCHNETQQYKATIYEEQGEVTKNIYLCDKHKDAMRKSGVELEIC